jgi:hypothetical protein
VDSRAARQEFPKWIRRSPSGKRSRVWRSKVVRRGTSTRSLQAASNRSARVRWMYQRQTRRRLKRWIARSTHRQCRATRRMFARQRHLESNQATRDATSVRDDAAREHNRNSVEILHSMRPLDHTGSSTQRRSREWHRRANHGGASIPMIQQPPSMRNAPRLAPVPSQRARRRHRT